MKKRKFLLLLAFVFIIPAILLFAGCGETEKKAESFAVELLSNSYTISNNQIDVEWGECVSLVDTDFSVVVTFDDGSTQAISKQTAENEGFTYQSNLPTGSQLEDGKTPIGQYTVSIGYKEFDNYVVTINVTKKNISLTELDWGTTSFEYDGTAKTVQIQTELPDYIDVEYQNNEAVNAGQYTATANFVTTDNHYNLLTTTTSKDWSVEKADVDVSGVGLTQDQFVYNGAQRVVEIDEETLPDGVSAEIVSGASAKNAGEYQALVRFTADENHNKPQDKLVDYVISKAQLVVTATVDGEVVCGNDVVAGYGVTGLVGGEVASDVLTGTAVYNFGGYNKTQSQQGESFDLTVSGLSAVNYQITYQKATFVAQKPYVMITVGDDTTYAKDLTVLDKSGTYKLLDDLDYSTIVIGSNTADNLQIVIDLNQNALSCTGSNIQNSIYAISANNLIAIKNGTIYTFDAECGIYANQNNKFVLRNDLTINSNCTAIKLEGENACVETIANITVSQIAINCQNAKLKIITGTVEGNSKSLLLNGGDVQVLGGNFNGSLDVTNVEEFITGGCFNTNPTAYIERHHYVEASYGLYYIQELPDLTDIELLNNTYIIGVNENLDDYELVCENVYFYSDNKTVAELSKLLTIQGLEDLTTAGEHTVTFTYDNYYSFNLVKQITINCVSVVGFEPKYDYVIESNIPELFTVYAILSNGEKLEICLTDCVSDEQIEEFVSMSHTSGEIYNFSASYAGCNDTLQINIEKLEIVSVEFEYPRQFVENQLDTKLIVIFNNSDLENTYDLEYNDILIESIVDQDNNIYANLDEINKVGTYTFVVKIGLTLEWDDNLNDYVWTYSTSKTVVLKLVGADNVSDFGTEDVDVLVGQKPLFWYDTYGGEYHYDEDILDQMNYDANDFDYNTAGNYTVTFNFDGIEQTIEINVHNPNDAMYLYLSGEYIIGGINNITISGLDWDYNDINETFDFAYIIGEVPDLTVAGEYSIQYQYAGLVAQGTIKIVNSTDVEYIMASNQYFELNTDKRAKFTAIHYNGSYGEVEVTNDMIVSGDAPNYTFVGTYSFTIEYMGKTQYMTIYVYDPNDESVVEINWNGNSYLVWTYTNNGTDFDIDVREYGLYVRVERANRTSQIVPVTKDMITFNVEYAKDALNNNTMPEISYTVTYQGRTLYGYAVLVNENMIDGMQSMCDISLIHFGGYESKIAVEKGKALEGYSLRYYYQGYSYYLPITAENMLDANSEPQSLAVAGAYTVTVNGSEQLLIVYDFDDADIDGYFYDYSVTLVENSTTEDLLDAILGRTVNVYYDFEYPYNSSTQSYSYHESFVLTEDMLGDLSQLDLSNVGYTTIFVNYNGQEVPIGITIAPNVDGQTKKTYKLNLYGFNLDADMYDEYIYMSNHWYRYVVVDEDNSIISLSNGYLSQLYVVNDDSHILENFVAGEFFDKETPEEYMLLNMMQGSMYKLKIYNNMFADMYEYENSEFVYEQTMLCEVEVENDITYIIIQGTKYVADENNNLSVYVVGNITYSYEALVDGEQMKAEFREYNGEKIMYYYVLQENEYVIAGSFEWEFNQDETLIDCYMKGNPNPIVSFVFENGQVVDIVM